MRELFIRRSPTYSTSVGFAPADQHDADKVMLASPVCGSLISFTGTGSAHVMIDFETEEC
jgi:hypothetical protein